tara:strand:- start:60 stop:788 length:729 start_codon:yes stop_codon:yes gene_type:complete
MNILRLDKYLYFFFNILIKKIKTRKVSYSFGGIDSLINYIFKDTPRGIYVDVGCHHPILNNNTYLLYKKGWNGINVDLDKKNIELFNYARNKDTNINIAASDAKKEADLYFYHNKSTINTIDKKTSDYQKASVKEIRKINADKLENIINNSPHNNKVIDFLSIDVEGHELEVLKGLNFKKYKPKVIVVEYLDLTAKKLEIKNLNINNVLTSELYLFIVNNGYTLVNCLHSDLVFINNNFRDK